MTALVSLKSVCATITAVLLLSGLAVAAPVATNQSPVTATTAADASAVKLVSVHADRMSIVDAIDLMFKGTGYRYTVLPGVEGTVTLSVTDMPFDKALKLISDTVGLQYKVSGNRFIFSAKPKTQLDNTTVAPQQTMQVPVDMQQGSDILPVMAPPQVGLGPIADPVYYGHGYPYPVPAAPPYFDVGNVRTYTLPPFSLPFTVVSGYGYQGAPELLPPPGLRSPSYQRFLSQMRAVHSYPGFPGPTYGPYGSNGYGY